MMHPCQYLSIPEQKAPNYEGRMRSKIISIIANDETFEADRTLLSQHSAYFKAMFEGHFADSKKEKITLEEIESSHLKIFINFIERKNVSEEETDVWIECFSLADKLQSDSFKKYILKKLSGKVSLNQLGDRLIEDNTLFSRVLFSAIVSRLKKDRAKNLSAQIDRLTKKLESRKDIEPEEKQELIQFLKKELVSLVNRHEVPMKEIAGEKSASKTIAWLLPASSDLRYADFTGLKITNEDLEQLTKDSPNLEHLFIPASKFMEMR